MARVGRKRKQNVERYRDGRVKPETVADIKSVVHAQRARVVPLKELDSEKASTPLGILHLNGKLTLAQYQAGVELTGVIARWRAAISAPSPNPVSMGGRSGPISMLDEATEIKRKRRAIEDYERTKGVLTDCGYAVYTTVMHLCGSERDILSVDPARRGLDALVKHFGLEHFEMADKDA